MPFRDKTVKIFKYLRNAGFNLSIDYRKINSINAIFQAYRCDYPIIEILANICFVILY